MLSHSENVFQGHAISQKLDYTSISNLSVIEVSNLLRNTGFPEFAEHFKSRQVSGFLITQIKNTSTLYNELSLPPIVQTLNLFEAIMHWNSVESIPNYLLVSQFGLPNQTFQAINSLGSSEIASINALMNLKNLKQPTQTLGQRPIQVSSQFFPQSHQQISLPPLPTPPSLSPSYSLIHPSKLQLPPQSFPTAPTPPLRISQKRSHKSVCFSSSLEDVRYFHRESPSGEFVR